MSEEPIQITVQILDNEYRVACPQAECEALQEAARYLDEKMQAIRDTGKVVSLERIAVMAALNISYELLGCKNETAELDDIAERQVQNLLHKVELALSKTAQSEV